MKRKNVIIGISLLVIVLFIGVAITPATAGFIDDLGIGSQTSQSAEPTGSSSTTVEQGGGETQEQTGTSQTQTETSQEQTIVEQEETGTTQTETSGDDVNIEQTLSGTVQGEAAGDETDCSELIGSTMFAVISNFIYDLGTALENNPEILENAVELALNLGSFFLSALAAADLTLIATIAINFAGRVFDLIWDNRDTIWIAGENMVLALINFLEENIDELVNIAKTCIWLAGELWGLLCEYLQNCEELPQAPATYPGISSFTATSLLEPSVTSTIPKKEDEDTGEETESESDDRLFTPTLIPPKKDLPRFKEPPKLSGAIAL